VIAWGTGLLILILVLFFKHAGGDQSNANTGGWCWVVADNYKDLFIWELIGGKAVEWISCFIIVPFLYALISFNLVRLGQIRDPVQDNLSSRESISYNFSDVYSVVSDGLTSAVAEPIVVVAERKTSSLYSQFYGKLMVVPIVFIFIRLWSSLRVVVMFANGGQSSSFNDVLLYLQAFFDPSQGIFNAFLFVLWSQQDREKFASYLAEVALFYCGVQFGNGEVSEHSLNENFLSQYSNTDNEDIYCQTLSRDDDDF